MSARALDSQEADAILRSLRHTRAAHVAADDNLRKDLGVARRSYGTGSLFARGDAWYGQWRIGGRLVKRKLGARREPGSRQGLTKAQAEAELRRRISDLGAAAPAERIGVEEAGRRYVRHLETVRQRKRSTTQDYEIMLRRHLSPFFGETPLERIDADEVELYVQAKLRAGFARQTVVNQLNLLHGIFSHAVKRGWTSENPVVGVERPPSGRRDPDIRFLRADELEALLRAVPRDEVGVMESALYLTAAMTGLRQGELVALRWSDVDWGAGVIRVRRSYTRGEFGAPKSRRSSRAVPMADRVAGELERHFQRSAFRDDTELVFCHPQTGRPYDASRLRKRFKRAVQTAGVRDVRFHDLRHTFGTQMAAAGAPLRALMEWMGHCDFATTLVYADYAPDPAQGAALAERAFGRGINSGINPSDTEQFHEEPKPL
jgi:integrase